MRHLLTLADVQANEIDRIFAITEDLKTKYAAGLREPLLPGRVMALLFEKPSLRTRVSFEAGMIHLGGSSLFLGDDVGFGARESLGDFGRVLSQYVDVIVVRAFLHKTVRDLVQYSSCSVINGLTDDAHPCQALADLYTLKELFGRLAGRTLAYIGDGNNVARSLAVASALFDLSFLLAAPPDYDFPEVFRSRFEEAFPGRPLVVEHDPLAAVAGAHVVYTDVWASMG
ncbi:MAG TPA: ornithine carbamoyltransferase, partial [Pirellulales bacterium]